MQGLLVHWRDDDGTLPSEFSSKGGIDFSGSLSLHVFFNSVKFFGVWWEGFWLQVIYTKVIKSLCITWYSKLSPGYVNIGSDIDIDG